jgi:pimeloyl-ACP methyl ester carboxylesterase
MENELFKWVKHLALYFQEHGDKNAPLMLFLHGGGVSGWMWDKQVQYFKHYYCIVPDLPQHGQNKDGSPFSIKSSAEELITLIEEKAKGKTVIGIGFSLGSQVLLQILSMKPDLIDFAIINSALIRPNPYIRKWIRPTVKLSFPFIKKRWFSKLQAKTLYIGEDDFEKYYEESCQMELDALVRILEENMSFTIPDGFSKASGKILVTVGEKEKAMMKKSAKDITEATPNSTGIIIPNMGHGVPIAMPNFFNKMAETWIEEGEIPEECKRIR